MLNHFNMQKGILAWRRAEYSFSQRTVLFSYCNCYSVKIISNLGIFLNAKNQPRIPNILSTLVDLLLQCCNLWRHYSIYVKEIWGCWPTKLRRISWAEQKRKRCYVIEQMGKRNLFMPIIQQPNKGREQTM